LSIFLVLTFESNNTLLTIGIYNMGDNHHAEVQAELQQYLNSKNINSLFVQLVESILIEKPENPIAFMVEYLIKQFPNETRDYQRLIIIEYTARNL
jgi:hypothetical protein